MSQKRKILIVEDDYILYEELETFFEEKGFSIVRHADDRAVDNYDDAVQLLQQHEPDIAILDIKIRGERDGIDLGSFISQRYNIPVIYLSAYNNYENTERIRKTGNERFVVKSSKPLDKEQLWTTFNLALPQADHNRRLKSIGEFFSVKEMRVAPETDRLRAPVTEPKDPLEIETFLKWEEIVYIESYNLSARGSGNNNILIHSTTPGKAYMMHSSLNELEKKLPAYFVRFDQATIVNFHKIDGRNKAKTRYKIGALFFAISDVYKKKALEKIAALPGSGFMTNIPET